MKAEIINHDGKFDLITPHYHTKLHRELKFNLQKSQRRFSEGRWVISESAKGQVLAVLAQLGIEVNETTAPLDSKLPTVDTALPLPQREETISTLSLPSLDLPLN